MTTAGSPKEGPKGVAPPLLVTQRGRQLPRRYSDPGA